MIIFDEQEGIFRIDTKNTTYAMKIAHEKFLVHLYYGKQTDNVGEYYKEYPVAFAPYVAETGADFSLDTVPTELSFFDSGDQKHTAIKVKNGNGDSTTLFYYQSHRIFKGREPFENMPYSRGGDETLEVVFFDEVSGCELHAYYVVFAEDDVITRYLRFVNKGENTLSLESVTGAQLDLPKNDYKLITLCGDYFYERNEVENPLVCGVQKIYSKRGHSSHHFNPFMALKKADTTENEGDAYAMQFVYSGDFSAQVEKTFSGKVRLLMGLNEDTFSWRLEKGEQFVTPEVVMSYSNRGMNGLSQNLHNHARNAIINPSFVYKKRPVVINTWEAMYFNIDEEVLFRYAEKAKELGIDTLVVDDGWFGSRNDDGQGLGDWFVNTAKFKDGLQAFSDKVHALGLNLGIWIEPEMINPKSELYEKHPDWVLQCKDRELSLSRRQYVLDLTNDEVVDYIVERLKKTFDGVKLEYIKWDFNRSISEAGSLRLPKERQGEARHRFVLGSYKLHKKLTEAFKDVMFEGCSGGGGRFDLGILFYCPQIWTSDNTDPVNRLNIQKGTSLAYPLSTISSHVSDSLFNKLEGTPDYNFRFNVALGGVLGYEMNITRLSAENEGKIKNQILTYEKIHNLILQGDYYRLAGLKNMEYGFTVIAKDKTEFLLVYQNLNGTERKKIPVFGLEKKAVYQTADGKVYRGEELEKDGLELPSVSSPYAYAYVRAVKN